MSHIDKVLESLGYRLSKDEIKKKIERLKDRMKKNPKDAEDIQAEIDELKDMVK